MATYWVEAGHGGTDSGTETNPWLTIDQAMNAAGSGDKVWVKGGTDYTENATIDTGAAATLWITFEGYSSSTGDGGQFTIDATGKTNGITAGLAATSVYYVFRNMIIENASGTGFNASGKNYLAFDNCEFSNNGDDGLEANNISLLRCEFSGNTDNGITGSSASAAICKFYNNGGTGIEGSSTAACYSEFYSNTGYYPISGGGVSVLINCTIDGANNASAYGPSMSNSSPSLLINNIIHDLAYGVLGSDGGGQNVAGANNLMYSCTTTYYNWPDRAKESDITDPPGFTDEANNDYTLAAGSAARNAGADASGTSSPGMDIGAHQSADAGGGGSRVIITG